MVRLKLLANPVVEEESSSSDHKPQVFNIEDTSKTAGLPKFIRHHESTTIELFYDLFFVANLTSFTAVHEVNSKKTLTSYIGFFCILWFTWCQTSLFDVRFMADGWLERLAKACHLGVMVGLSTVGPHFDTESAIIDEEGQKERPDSTGSLQTLALVLVVSRVILAIQYAITTYHVRNYQKTKLPLALLSAGNIVAAIIYLIIGLALYKLDNAYRSFYVMAVFEMVYNIAVSSKWKVASFKATHLVERMSLLTLYILGEGVIDILKGTGKLSKINNKAWSGTMIGLIFAAILCVYLLYMLYFDCLDNKHFGSIRQQLWAFLHFPFHAFLVLALTGMSQFVKWQKVVEASTPLGHQFQKVVDALPDFDSELWTESKIKSVWEAVSTIANATTNTYPVTTVNIDDEIEKSVSFIQQGFTKGNQTNYDQYIEEFSNLLATLSNSIFQTYGFEAGDVEGVELAPTEELSASFYTIRTVFVYYFISAGATLILMGTLSLIMDSHRGWRLGSIIRFASHVVIGLALALISLAAFTKTDGQSIVMSSWVVPSYTIATLLVLGVHHIKWGATDRDHEVHDHKETGHGYGKEVGEF